MDCRHINFPKCGKENDSIEEYNANFLRPRPGSVLLPFYFDSIGKNLVTWPRKALRRLGMSYLVLYVL